MRARLGVLLVSLTGGCVPVVAGLPPLRVATGAGAAIGDAVTPTEAEVDRTGSHGPETAVAARVSAFPFQVGDTLGERRFEVGIGYEVEMLTSAQPDRLDRHALLVELDHYPWQTEVGGRGLFRLTLRAAGEFIAGEGEVGGGATLGAGVELVRWADLSRGRPTRRGVAVARIRGEHGLGVEVATAYRNVGPAEYWTISASFTLRSPSMIVAVFRSLGSFLGIDPGPPERH